MPPRVSLILCVLPLAGSIPAIADVVITDDLPFLHETTAWQGPHSLGLHGDAVAVQGDWAVVGRPGDTSDGAQSGAVDVYRRTATEASLEGLPWAWSLVSTIRPMVPQPGARFGDALALDGSTLVIGGWRHGNNHGAAWVTELATDLSSDFRIGTMLAPEDLQPGDYFGCDVAIDGDVIAVGGWGGDVSTPDDTAGKVWMFQLDEGVFEHAQVLVAGGGGVPDDRFGTALDLDGGTLAVGAPNRDQSSGVVYLYTKQNGEWQFLQEVPSPSSQPWARFGAAVDLVPGRDSPLAGMLVGSPGDNELGPLAGAGWVFAADGTGGVDAVPETKLTTAGGQAWDLAGSSVVGLDAQYDGQGHNQGDDEEVSVLILGAPGWRDPISGLVSGAAIFFTTDHDQSGGGEEDGSQGDGGDWINNLTISGDAIGDAAGHSIAVDFSTVQAWDTDVVSIWVGAPGHSSGQGLASHFDVVVDDYGDCNDDYRLDLMEVLLLGSEVDCDGDGTHDACQLKWNDMEADCDGNGALDSCQIDDQPQLDCDGDGNLDACQIAWDPHMDCDGNSQLDICQLQDPMQWDCDGDGWIDLCQIAEDPQFDCDGNGVVDGCQLVDPPEEIDCDGDGLLDTCQIADMPEDDCDGDGQLDSCQVLDDPTVNDCDGNGQLDVCQILDPPMWDCDGDGTIDNCQIAVDPELDCDENGQVDSCDIANDPAVDCDGDGWIDSCQVAEAPEMFDCNANGIVDSCELAGPPNGADCDDDGTLDACQIAANPMLDCDSDGMLDICGTGGPVDLMTQAFDFDLDLTGLGGRWVPPSGGQGPWTYCTVQATGTWIDPSGHSVLMLADDDMYLYTMPFPFPFMGQNWNQIGIGSNGYVTFGQIDTTYQPSISVHFSMPRISALFADFDPSVSGDVRVGPGPAGSVIITWLDVPLWQQSERINRVQLALHPDGAFESTWELLDVDQAVSGISAGGGVPLGFMETDLSDAFNCDPHAEMAIADCNSNGVWDACEIPLPGDPWWGVEHFAADADLGMRQVRWTPHPDASPPHWEVCTTPATDFQIDPLSGIELSMDEDDSVLWSLGFSFPFEGQSYDDVFVGSNGYVTFGTAETDYSHLPQNHFQSVGIAAMRTDLDPTAGGMVTVATGPLGSIAITWLNVPMYSGSASSAGDQVSMQMLLHPDGAIETTWLEAPSAFAIVGPSAGNGIPPGFAQTDLSAAELNCMLQQPWDDCDGSGVHDNVEIALGCLYDMGGGVVLECGTFIGGDADGPSVACSRDITLDDRVDVMDLIAVLHAWGPLKLGDQHIRADVAPAKRDLRIDLNDLIAVIESMGDVCGQP